MHANEHESDMTEPWEIYVEDLCCRCLIPFCFIGLIRVPNNGYLMVRRIYPHHDLTAGRKPGDMPLCRTRTPKGYLVHTLIKLSIHGVFVCNLGEATA